MRSPIKTTKLKNVIPALLLAAGLVLPAAASAGFSITFSTGGHYGHHKHGHRGHKRFKHHYYKHHGGRGYYGHKYGHGHGHRHHHRKRHLHRKHHFKKHFHGNYYHGYGSHGHGRYQEYHEGRHEGRHGGHHRRHDSGQQRWGGYKRSSSHRGKTHQPAVTVQRTARAGSFLHPDHETCKAVRLKGYSNSRKATFRITQCHRGWDLYEVANSRVFLHYGW